MASPRLVTVGVAAELLGRSYETVYRLARRRRIAYFRDPDTGGWLFSRESIEAYIGANLVPARPDADLTPIRAPRARRASTRAASQPSEADEPWRGSVFGPRDGPAQSPGGRTQSAASSAARTNQRAATSKASASR